MRIALAFITGILVTSTIWPQGRNRVVNSSQLLQDTKTALQNSQDDVVRINTRVVLVDALVKDKRTTEPIDGLTRENFEILDNGQPRAITYFSREGDDRKRPLALLLILAPMDDGGRRDFQRSEILNSMATALNKLPNEDEVAVMLLNRASTGQMLVELTRDRGKVIAALGNLPKLAQTKYVPAAKILQDFALSTVAARPQFQTTIIMLTDSVFLMSHADRDELNQRLIRANVSLNALVTGTDWMFTLFRPLLKGEEDFGVSLYDVPQYIARHTGGDYVRPRKKKDYGPALEKLIGNLAARYSLGFTLGQDESDDGRMHQLEVRAKAKDSQGKERRVEVSAREGYYLPKR